MWKSKLTLEFRLLQYAEGLTKKSRQKTEAIIKEKAHKNPGHFLANGNIAIGLQWSQDFSPSTQVHCRQLLIPQVKMVDIQLCLSYEQVLHGDINSLFSSWDLNGHHYLPCIGYLIIHSHFFKNHKFFCDWFIPAEFEIALEIH